MTSYVIVGASLAGLSAAETLRRSGYEGRLVMVGQEPRRPYDRPPLSKQILNGKWTPEQAFLRKDADYYEPRVWTCWHAPSSWRTVSRLDSTAS